MHHGALKDKTLKIFQMLLCKSCLYVSGTRGMEAWLRLSLQLLLCVIKCIHSELEVVTRIQNVYISKCIMILEHI